MGVLVPRYGPCACRMPYLTPGNREAEGARPSPKRSYQVPFIKWQTRKVCKRFPTPQSTTTMNVTLVARRMALLVKTRL